MTYSLDMPFAYGGPLGEADFRQSPEDFVVTEELGFVPEGVGEHQYLHIQKRGVNTEWVAQKIARLAEVKSQDVGFCGLKDRHGIASQWFSVYLPKGGPIEWRQLEKESALRVLSSSAAKRKLRRGQHQGNHFRITLRNVAGFSPEKLRARLDLVMGDGVPNYFGEQRFGRDGSNLIAARKWLEEGVPLHKLGGKSMIMSAARSNLFNRVLAERVRGQSWKQLLPGDIPGGPTGPLWGRGRSAVSDATRAIEERALADFASWLHGLEHCGLTQERRALVLRADALKWDLADQSLVLEFRLGPGEFATVVLREIFALRNASV